MSPAPSNKRFARALCAGIYAFALAACTHASNAPTQESTPRADAGRVAYVRMEELVKVHPLYSQLARLDEDVAALQLRSVGSDIARSGANVAKEETALQRELDGAAERTKRLLNEKQQEYARREQSAINAALAASGSTSASGAGIAAGMAAESRTQASSAAAAAQRNFDAYRQQVVAQNEAAVRSLNASISQRAARTYRAKAEELQRKEADFALQQASTDSAERLSLRTKLSNLALDDASRADVRAQLAALDRKEADALAVVKNRDDMTLASLQVQLRRDVRTELAGQVADLRRRTVNKINDRELETRQQLVAQIGVPQTGGTRSTPGDLAPDMRSKLEALHRKYQNDFNADAAQTIAQFRKTRSDLTRRFRVLEGVDSAAQAGANKQIGALQKQRSDLYGEMVAQIGREVKVIAEKRGINVVVSGVVAPAGGVDLTTDAEKDIESLHE